MAESQVHLREFGLQRKSASHQSMVDCYAKGSFAMEPLARRKFISVAAMSDAGLASLNTHDRLARSAQGPATIGQTSEHLCSG